MERIPIQTVVRHRPSGRLGVVAPDRYNICIPEETLVVFEGEQVGCGTFSDDLEVIGPEHAVAEPVKCGFHTGENACMFLSSSVRGWHCERFGADRYRFIGMAEKSTKSIRHPTQLYPACQLPVSSMTTSS